MFKKFVTGFVSGTLLLSSAMPLFAATNVKVKNNGVNSTNKVKVTNVSKNKVKQSNVTLAGVGVVQLSNTGLNNASGNTGGDVKVDTGDVDNSAKVDVSGGDNVAFVNECGCTPANTKVVVSGNGVNSTNKVKVTDVNVQKTSQSNLTGALVVVGQLSNTGGNTASGNTGGDVNVVTGNVDNTVDVSVTGGSNSVNPTE